MRCRRHAILASLLLLFWCSGAARYVHERTEHADVASHHTHPDHADCPVCQSLAAIQLQSPQPVMVPSPMLERVARVEPTQPVAPALPLRFAHPSTGPPTV